MNSNAPNIQKYPRTCHLADSCLQPGDDGSDRMNFKQLKQKLEQNNLFVVYEEKVDGANCAFRFDQGGELFAQSRGHYINVNDRNAPRERDWSLLKEWLQAHKDEFLERFEDRYIVYGEWMNIVHSVSYNSLPHFFLEFDIYDLEKSCFLSTDERRKLCKGLPIQSVPVLYKGPMLTLDHMKGLVGPSCFRTPDHIENWQHSLKKSCDFLGDNFIERLAKMDQSNQIEGIYIKVENEFETLERYKWVRTGFMQVILDSDEHWQSRFPVSNLLENQTDVFPNYLARTRQISETYNADEPWIYAPWINAKEPISEVGFKL